MKKLDLSDVTFIIPFHKDSDERTENLGHVVEFLISNFETKINVLDEKILDKTTLKHPEIFHRTKVLNIGIKAAKTKYVCLYDTDVVFRVAQFIYSLEELNLGSTLVYPYDGRMYELYRSYLKDGNILNHKESFASDSYGGAVFANREEYIKMGMENENFVGWGAEDAERKERVLKLGGTITRIPGCMYHIEHPRGVNSSTLNPYHEQNYLEYEKVKNMDCDSLEEYIKTWEWTK